MYDESGRFRFLNDAGESVMFFAFLGKGVFGFFSFLASFQWQTLSHGWSTSGFGVDVCS
jgi:hypothetical protein